MTICDFCDGTARPYTDGPVVHTNNCPFSRGGKWQYHCTGPYCDADCDGVVVMPDGERISVGSHTKQDARISRATRSLGEIMGAKQAPITLTTFAAFYAAELKRYGYGEITYDGLRELLESDPLITRSASERGTLYSSVQGA